MVPSPLHRGQRCAPPAARSSPSPDIAGTASRAVRRWPAAAGATARTALSSRRCRGATAAVRGRPASRAAPESRSAAPSDAVRFNATIATPYGTRTIARPRRAPRRAPSRTIGAAGGSSSVGRASAFQAECRGFETRLPLHPLDRANAAARADRTGALHPGGARRACAPVTPQTTCGRTHCRQ